jgi:hypothetical protein
MPTVQVQARHPSGYLVRFECERDKIDAVVKWLQENDYSPDLQGDGWRRTPDGLPLCGKHSAAMPKRERQGDSWFSHAVQRGDITLYCRGFPHGPREQDGFYAEALTQ